MINKLVLGTVQFGLNYGINNKDGQVTPVAVRDILKYAHQNGITKLDTSAAYGESEIVLGDNLNSYSDFKIISKYPKCSVSVEKMFSGSLNQLNRKQLYGYLLHHFEIYENNPQIWNDFLLLKERNLVEKIGFSLYEPQELELLLRNNVDFDLVQIPYNIFDRKFEPYLCKLKERNIEIHVRSTFLQGLFFIDRDNIPQKIKPLKKYLSMIDKYSKGKQMSISEIALNFNLNNENIDGVLIGVDNAKQLEDNINSISNKKIELDIDIKEKELLNPVNWK